MHHRFATIVASGLLAFGSGCALSNSSANSSASISNAASRSFEWSSNSSESSSRSSTEESAYREDVSDYTVASSRMGSDMSAYRMGLGRIAQERGITNWEEDSLTCASIGLGLRRAEVDEAGLEEFAANLFAEDFALDSARGHDLRAGYESIP